jgi:hypothetical protein
MIPQGDNTANMKDKPTAFTGRQAVAGISGIVLVLAGIAAYIFAMFCAIAFSPAESLDSIVSSLQWTGGLCVAAGIGFGFWDAYLVKRRAGGARDLFCGDDGWSYVYAVSTVFLLGILFLFRVAFIGEFMIEQRNEHDRMLSLLRWEGKQIAQLQERLPQAPSKPSGKARGGKRAGSARR